LDDFHVVIGSGFKVQRSEVHPPLAAPRATRVHGAKLKNLVIQPFSFALTFEPLNLVS
jgi:hypothetical protein